MVDKWLYTAELGGDPWVLPILNAVNNKVKSEKISAISPSTHELVGYISIQFNILDHVIERINENVKTLYNEPPKYGPEYATPERQGYAIPINNKLIDACYDLITDINSFLFTLKSVCDLMKKLFACIYSYAGQPIEEKNIISKIISLLENNEQETEWFQTLANLRNFSIHDGAPYIAIDLSCAPHYDLLIMKKNLKNFDDPKDFVKLSKLNEIAQGFADARSIIQKDLIDLLNKL